MVSAPPSVDPRRPPVHVQTTKVRVPLCRLSAHKLTGDLFQLQSKFSTTRELPRQLPYLSVSSEGYRLSVIVKALMELLL